MLSINSVLYGKLWWQYSTYEYDWLSTAVPGMCMFHMVVACATPFAVQNHVVGPTYCCMYVELKLHRISVAVYLVLVQGLSGSDIVALQTGVALRCR